MKNKQLEKVDRFEVIDDTGRAYVKGSIYGTPVSVELSYQDDGKTLKVFVTEKKESRTIKKIIEELIHLPYDAKQKDIDSSLREIKEIIDNSKPEDYGSSKRGSELEGNITARLVDSVIDKYQSNIDEVVGL